MMFKQGIIAYRIGRRPRQTWPRATPVPARATMRLSQARFEFRWQDQFNLGLDPDTDLDTTTKPCPRTAPRWRISAPCAGPSLWSMKITQEVREYAAARGVGEAEAVAVGMQAKAEEFNRAGGDFYIPIATLAP